MNNLHNISIKKLYQLLEEKQNYLKLLEQEIEEIKTEISNQGF
jgi:hypothetical protein